MSGPAVSFGYEETSYAAQSEGTDAAYHVNSPEIVLPGLKVLQSPIVSRSGNLELTGHRITGSCKFYLPSLHYIKSLDNFKDTVAFSEIESYDKLIDIERVIQNPADITSTGDQTIDLSPGSTYPPGYELDRVRFKIKSADNYEIADFTTGSFFKPYITTIGLYNENMDLLVVGKLGQPIRMSSETDTTFILRWDT